MVEDDWLRDLEEEDLADVVELLRQVRRSFSMNVIPPRASRYPREAPERLPVGTEAHWERRRTERVQLLQHKGVLGELRARLSGELVIEADVEKVRSVLERAIAVQGAPKNRGTGPNAASSAVVRGGPLTGRPTTAFVVHGHDTANLEVLRRLLEAELGLRVIVMSDEPARGRTLIEKFEEEAASADYAVVLLTPDDQVRSASGEYAQSRPNTIFELGWFYAKIGRERVVMVVRDGVSIHSDLDGVQQLRFRESVKEVFLGLKTEIDSLAGQG